MSAFTNIAQFTFIEPFFADYLDNRYNLKPDMIGIIFLSIGLGYAISCQIVSRLIPKGSLKRMLIFGLLCIGVATAFYGPSNLFGISGHVWISTVALFGAGLTSAFCLIPVIPEMIDESYDDDNINVHLGRQAYRDMLNDHISGLYNGFFAGGNTMGPLLGNWLYVKYGCPTAGDFIASFIMIFAVIYFLAGDDIIYKRILNPQKPDHKNDTLILRADLSRIG